MKSGNKVWGPYPPGGLRAKNRNERMQEQKDERGKEAPKVVPDIHVLPSQAPNPSWLLSTIWLDHASGPWSCQLL